MDSSSTTIDNTSRNTLPPPNSPSMEILAWDPTTFDFMPGNTKQDPGVLIAPKMSAYNLDPPKEQIRISANSAGNVWQGSVLVTRNTSFLHLFLGDATTEVVFDGTHNNFAVSDLPRYFWVQAQEGYSADMRDMEIRIQAQNLPQGVTLPDDFVKFTCVWVDTPQINFSGTVSADDSAGDNYKNNTDTGNTDLGFQNYNPPGAGAAVGWGFEASGLVHPSNFSYPNSDLKLDRDSLYRAYVGQNLWPNQNFKNFGPIPPGNDTSIAAYRDDNPDSDASGNIYDLDAPWLACVNSPQNEVRRGRWDFKEFASITVLGALLID